MAIPHSVGAFAIIPSNNLLGGVPFRERLEFAMTGGDDKYIIMTGCGCEGHLLIGHPAPSPGVRSSNHGRACDRRDGWVGPSSGPTDYMRPSSSMMSSSTNALSKQPLGVRAVLCSKITLTPQTLFGSPSTPQPRHGGGRGVRSRRARHTFQKIYSALTSVLVEFDTTRKTPRQLRPVATSIFVDG